MTGRGRGKGRDKKLKLDVPFPRKGDGGGMASLTYSPPEDLFHDAFREDEREGKKRILLADDKAIFDHLHPHCCLKKF